jgi:hypothetical protein
LRVALADGLHVAAFLQQLAAHVQRQVGRVDHALHEAQVAGQQRLGVVHDEDALHVQLHAGGFLSRFHRSKGARPGCTAAACTRCCLPRGCGSRPAAAEVVADGLVELVVLLGRDVLLGRVHSAVAWLTVSHSSVTTCSPGWPSAFLPLFLAHAGWAGDVVGVLAHQRLQAPGGEVRRLASSRRCRVTLVPRSARSIASTSKSPAPLAGPAHALGRLQPGAARLHRDAVGHDEAGVEAHAELADQLRVGLLVARQARHELARAALGDGAQVVDGLLRRSCRCRCR